MRKLSIGFLVLVCVGFFVNNIFAADGALIDKLVEKDVLTEEEAKELSKECSSWIKNIKFYGDLRLRYENQETDTTTGSITTNAKRERARMRFRLGTKAKINDNLKVKAGLATGSSDPRSTNQSFDNNFSSKGINLDYAYLKYKANDYTKLVAGKTKLKEALWTPSDLLWDSDVNPEGAALNLKCKKTGLWLNTGYFVLEEISSGADPSMVFVQPGIKTEIDEVVLKASFNYYATNSVEGLNYSNITSGGSTNTQAADGSFMYDYDCWGFSAEAGLNIEDLEIADYTAIFADYIQNPDPNEEEQGYMFGVKFGNKKVKKKDSWVAKALYRRIEKDAWLDFLGDSDVIGGITDAKGFEFILKYAVCDNVILALDYYNSETIKAASKREQDLIQLDCILKF